MRVINASPDKYLVECIELDLYDLLYKSEVNKWPLRTMIDEVWQLLKTYQSTNAIKKFDVIKISLGDVMVCIYAPGPKTIRCRAP